MDDDGGFYLFEDRADGGGGGDVAGVVGAVGKAVCGGVEVEDGDCGGGGGEQLGDDMVAEETAAADYEDGGAEVGG